MQLFCAHEAFCENLSFQGKVESMTIRNRTGAVALGLLAIVLMGRLPLAAQEPATTKSAPPPPAQKKQIRRVPDYFGQIGLTPEQRTSIYVVLNKRHEKIDALEKQIVTERAAMLNECEVVLNETQKKLLDNLRKAASEPKPIPLSKPAEALKPTESLKGSN
jgi:Spy/CpxP family protein refolding chaperone